MLNATITVDAHTNQLIAAYEVTAPTLRQAADEALRAARVLPAKPTNIHVQRLDEWTAEQKRPRPQDLIGVSEAADLLRVSRQRVSQLLERPEFPPPVARLSAGPVWARASIEAFLKDWPRKPTGRPPDCRVDIVCNGSDTRGVHPTLTLGVARWRVGEIDRLKIDVKDTGHMLPAAEFLGGPGEAPVAYDLRCGGCGRSLRMHLDKWRHRIVARCSDGRRGKLDVSNDLTNDKHYRAWVGGTGVTAT